MSLRKEVPGRMPISAENDDCPPLGKRASSPGSERAAEAKKLRQHETPEVTVLEFEQELAVQEYGQLGSLVSLVIGEEATLGISGVMGVW